MGLRTWGRFRAMAGHSCIVDMLWEDFDRATIPQDNNKSFHRVLFQSCF
jgi:hypothetical protein